MARACAPAIATGYRDSARRHEVAGPAGAGTAPAATGARFARRAAAAAGALVLMTGAAAYPCRGFPAARLRAAAIGVDTIRKAAELHVNLGAGDAACPTIDALIASQMIEAVRADDPWGVRYEVICKGDEVSGARSAGPDRRMGTSDDVLAGGREAD